MLVRLWPTDTEVTGSIPVEAVIFSTVNGVSWDIAFYYITNPYF